MKYLICVLIMLGLISPAQARHRHAVPAWDPMCNITMPCQLPYASSPAQVRETRGRYVAREMGFGTPRTITKHKKEVMPHPRLSTVSIKFDARPRFDTQPVGANRSEVVEHPAGCPRSAFCACGAAVRLLGSARAAPWLARAWYGFKRAMAAPRMAGVRPHHVVALEYQVSGNLWMVYDANSGGHATRLHVIDISPYTIVDPRG
jgi:hypothetical protein